MATTLQLRGDVVANDKLVTSYEKDAEGYSIVPLGGFNYYNVHGDFYPAAQAIPQLNGDSHISNNLKEGTLYGEVQHPPFEAFDLPGVSKDDALARWFARLRKVDSTLTSHHIKALDYFTEGDGDWQNPANKVRVWGKIKPFGPYSKMVDDSFNSPSINTYFSVRSLCEPKPMRNGRRQMNMYELYTYDFVLRGGVANACKWKSRAGLESINPISISIDDIIRARDIISSERFGNEDASMIGEMDRLIDHLHSTGIKGINDRPSRFVTPNSARVL